jgi:peptidoglycan/LPS O-acetylase OafA/YrhL
MALYSLYLQPETYRVEAGEALATLTFLRSYLPSGVSIWANQWPIGHLWSLNVEEHSYIYLAIVALITRQLKKTLFLCLVLLLTAGAMLFFNFYYPGHPPAGASPWFVRSECAALGLMAAGTIRVIHHATWNLAIHRVLPLLPVLWVGIAVACSATYAHKGVQYTVAPLSLAFAINYLDRVPSIIKTALSWGPLRWFGRCSFSLYLWQQPFFLAALYNGMPRSVACATAIATGAISFYVFENPTRIKLNEAWRNLRNGAPIPAKLGAPQ